MSKNYILEKSVQSTQFQDPVVGYSEHIQHCKVFNFLNCPGLVKGKTETPGVKLV